MSLEATRANARTRLDRALRVAKACMPRFDGKALRHDVRNEINAPRDDASKGQSPEAAAAGDQPATDEEFETAISVENVTKKYGSHLAVDNVSFILPKGETIGLLGGNGAGKTTTISMIMGLTIPTSGRVKVLGHDMAHARHNVLSRMNFQSPYVALPARLTVRENLNVFGRLYGVGNLKTRIAQLVEQFGLADVLDSETGKLSSGQKTRVSIAKALLNKPEVLLLDEPTASLDPDRADWVRGLLIEYQRESGAAILMVSHNMLEVEQMCDYVVIMSLGCVVEIGTPEELIRLYECEKLQDVFLQIARGDEESW
jgi:ABC-2 type transport system ATP-binding protein